MHEEDSWYLRRIGGEGRRRYSAMLRTTVRQSSSLDGHLYYKDNSILLHVNIVQIRDLESFINPLLRKLNIVISEYKMLNRRSESMNF